MIEELNEDEIKKRILAFLEDEKINHFHPARIGQVTFAVYLEMFTSAKEEIKFAYNMTVFDLLCQMEKETKPLVKNLYSIPSKDRVAVMKASGWVLTSKQ